MSDLQHRGITVKTYHRYVLKPLLKHHRQRACPAAQIEHLRTRLERHLAQEVLSQPVLLHGRAQQWVIERRQPPPVQRWISSYSSHSPIANPGRCIVISGLGRPAVRSAGHIITAGPFPSIFLSSLYRGSKREREGVPSLPLLSVSVAARLIARPVCPVTCPSGTGMGSRHFPSA